MRFHLLLICAIIGCKFSEASFQVQKPGPCDFVETVNISSGHLDMYGNYHHEGTVYPKGLFAEYHYVIKDYNVMVTAEPHFRGCICKVKPCIRLCCLQKEENGINCVTTETLVVPTSEVDEEIVDLTGKDYGVLVGRPCEKMYVLEPQDYTDDKWFFTNGSVRLEDGDKKIAGPQEYCLRQIKNETDSITEALFCYFEKPDDVRLTLYPLGMIFSLPFLVITFCVYGFIPELRNLHGKSLMCYVFSLMTLYVSLSVVQLDGGTFMPEALPCIFSAYMIYISVLLCFFWLNVMCYDIWSTFRSGIRGRGGDRKRFLMYCVYAFGVPILLTCCLYLIDISSLDKELRPLMGIKRCWIQHSRLVELIYIYTPISIILIVNIILYSITAYKIFQVQKETSVIRNGDSQRHSRIDADKDRFFLYLRLFIVMGSTWCMESVSWVVIDSPYIFYVSDLLNCLQGFIIFILFVWKPKVKQLIIRRYRSIRNLPPTTSQMNSAGSRTETSRISSGIHQGVPHLTFKGNAEKPMLDNS